MLLVSNPAFQCQGQRTVCFTDVVLAEEGEDRLLLHINRQLEEKFRLAPTLQPMPDLCMDGKSWFLKRSWGQYNLYVANKPPARPALQPNPACRAFPTPLLLHCAMVGFRRVSRQVTAGQRRSWTPCIVSPVILVSCCKGFLSTTTLQAFFKAKTLILRAVRRRNSATCRDGVKCCLRSRKTSPWHGLQAPLRKAAGVRPCTDVLETSGISDGTGCQC